MDVSNENLPKYKVRGSTTPPKMKMTAEAKSKPKGAKKAKKKTSK